MDEFMIVFESFLFYFIMKGIKIINFIKNIILNKNK